ncbi:GNAT family N-acetyltransferase [Streptomyces candidus]|uniref:Ribosomal protein S18 acetylase RimI-like enzyme n=1 Tax=Streptomyces candidus TaxID=67283 RepID=A0A7X0HGL0_9ACTN|nr:GNAT family N-acetyltransferase [Streptomyces candidus]MBB6435788.1 ribosomal protein S18 acetylase RimI-like enzyme [Streptomyces candidus]GHH42447.1 GNAT family acetyltransferase [Streptomyces candidus]
MQGQDDAHRQDDTRGQDDAVRGLTARPLSRDAVSAWLELHEAVERIDRAGEHVDAAELVEVLEDPKLDLARDSTGWWDGERLVAYAVLHTPHGASDAARFGGDAAVHPDLRRCGLGTGLVTWLADRAAARHAENAELADLKGELLLDGLAGDEGLRRLAEKCGFAPSRWWFTMKHPLDSGRPDPRPAPEGTRSVPYGPEYDEATRLAHNDAFRDHWNFTELDRADWHTRVTGAGAFRPAMSRLLVSGDEVVAYLLAEENDAKTAATGRRDCHVGYLGTRRAWRGRGGAPALLAELLGAARDAGYDTASLTVDTANPSGALGFYQQSGFTVDRESVTYARALETAAPEDGAR